MPTKTATKSRATTKNITAEGAKVAEKNDNIDLSTYDILVAQVANGVSCRILEYIEELPLDAQILILSLSIAKIARSLTEDRQEQEEFIGIAAEAAKNVLYELAAVSA